jgi:hypothetical protein
MLTGFVFAGPQDKLVANTFVSLGCSCTRYLSVMTVLISYPRGMSEDAINRIEIAEIKAKREFDQVLREYAPVEWGGGTVRWDASAFILYLSEVFSAFGDELCTLAGEGKFSVANAARKPVSF